MRAHAYECVHVCASACVRVSLYRGVENCCKTEAEAPAASAAAFAMAAGSAAPAATFAIADAFSRQLTALTLLPEMSHHWRRYRSHSEKQVLLESSRQTDGFTKEVFRRRL